MRAKQLRKLSQPALNPHWYRVPVNLFKMCGMPSSLSLRDTILDAWKTNNRVTVFLVEHLPAELWGAKLPGSPRRTIRMLAGHIHNARCMWIKTLGKEHGFAVPRSVDRHKVKPQELIPALQRSGAGILSLLNSAATKGEGFLPHGLMCGATFRSTWVTF